MWKIITFHCLPSSICVEFKQGCKTKEGVNKVMVQTVQIAELANILTVEVFIPTGYSEQPT
jgi:hypothetical protein